MNHRILIIDDEVFLTDMLASHFRKCGFLVWTANTAQEAAENLNQNPDLILLDINMPDMDGIEYCQKIRQDVNCPILFLTARVEDSDKIKGFSAGGDDYVTKPFSLEELTARVNAHIRRELRSNEKKNIIVAGDLIINLSEQCVHYDSKEIPFSKREFELLAFLASHQSQTFDRERIYEAVWGYDAEGDSTVIKEHIRRIRNKLKESTGNEYITTIWGMGYRFEKQSSEDTI